MIAIRHGVEALQKKHPKLSKDGLNGGPVPLEGLVEDTRSNSAAVEASLDWIKARRVVTTVRTTHDTYFYKHEVEAEAGIWVPHLAFLVAVQLSGMPIQSNPDRPYAGHIPLGAKRPRSTPV